MNIASWNIRGLNQSHKQDEVRRLISTSRLSLLGILETKVSYGRRLNLARELMPDWEFLFNYSNNCNGRIWTAWDPSILSIHLLASSPQMMHLSVLIKESQTQLLMTLIYALNYANERVPLWEEINSIAPSAQQLPWIVLGDFNVVRHTSEKLGGDLSWTPDMDEFNCCCYTAELEDLQFRGNWFTWSNKCHSKPISRKLDRVLINHNWTTCFPNAEAEFILPGVSDHSPAIVRLGMPLPRLRKPFKFLTSWPSTLISNQLLQMHGGLPLMARRYIKFAVN